MGFLAFSNYTPHRDKKTARIMHFNRLVIHPDYVGLGLGVQFVNAASRIMIARGYDVRGKFSSTPVYRALLKYPHLWRLEKIGRDLKMSAGSGMERKGGFRVMVKTYIFRFIGK